MNRKKILIVDDDNRNVFAMQATLKRHGFDTVAASSAEQCLQILQKEKNINCVLMDMMLPEIDGYEAISMIKKDPSLKKLPVVAVTARAMQEDKKICIKAGADAYVSKPVDVDTLLQILNNY
jgi:two-component system, cell cycle response regulator DivK